MPAFRSKSRIAAEDFYRQSQDATNRAIQQGYGGVGGYLFGPNARERADIARADEQEQYALDQQRQQEQMLQALPQAVGGADALARAAGARPQDLTPEQRMGYGYNLAQQAQAGIDPNTTAGVMGANPMLNPAVAAANESAAMQAQQDYDTGTMRQQELQSRMQRNAMQGAAAGRTAGRENMLGGFSPQQVVDLQMQATGLSQGISSINNLNTLLDAFPNAATLLANPEARGAARAEMVAAAAAINSTLNLGALAKEEREFLFELQDNPDSVLGRLKANDKNTKALYNGLLRQMENKRSAMQTLQERMGNQGLVDWGDVNTPFKLPEGAGEIVGANPSITPGTKPQGEEAIIPTGTPLF